MTEPHLLRRARAALRQLTQLAAERAQGEQSVEQEFSAASEAARRTFEQTRAAVSARYDAARAAAEQAFTEARQAIPAACDAEYREVEQEFFTARRRVSEDYGRARDKAREEFQEARWTVRTVYEANKKELKGQMRDLLTAARKATSRRDRLDALHQQAIAHLDACHQSIIHLQAMMPRPVPPGDEDPFDLLKDAKSRAREAVAELCGLTLPKWLKVERAALLFLLLALVSAYPAWWLTDRQLIPTLLTVLGVTLTLGGGTLAALFLTARSQLRRAYEPVLQAIADGQAAAALCDQEAATVQKRLSGQLGALKDRRNHDLQKAQQRAQERLAELDRWRGEESRRVEAEYPPRLAEVRARRDAALHDAETAFHLAINAAEEAYTNDLEKAEITFETTMAEARDRHERDWNALCERWHDGIAQVAAEVDEIHREARGLFLDWEKGTPWAPPTGVPSGMRFGEVPVPLAEVPHGIPDHPRLREGLPEGFTLPALLPFPFRASLLLKAGDAGRAEAVNLLQAAMMRFLTSLPPGKVRFTILDPVGLGENFAAFMHLADYDEQLVTGRIWTEQAHIEQRLADLTAHMEVVIQKYLRNQFQSIEEYNRHAGEVAEPFRVLVVANFPTNFSVEAARRLVSIVSSGARCGVCTLVSVDTRAEMPQGFSLKDLETASTTLVFRDGRFLWKDPDFEPYRLIVDRPPDDTTGTPLLQAVGEAARGVKRVEVPFDFVAPPSERWWTASSRHGIDVPLGRAGATRLQHLKLGQGTAQHVLIAGKTGSGKSTLLHALITNLALHYGPDEIELYLVDFKKGVEFKTYATEELPHARVIAVESEREFGLSVLQRLDAELKLRGDLFREAGVQDVAGYRAAPGAGPCPRILLIVDEFQEFFVEDDRIAQEAALLLDRLVRQGRAFGIHVHLGSQTLSGAYTLARSTIDQMAVRIALQCSESDAYLILSKDNAAARLLSRPGEAIYNDANGLVEGNDIFQIVWLPEERREEYLRRVHQLAKRKGYVPPRPTIVFEGNVPADITKNDLLSRILEAAAWPEPARACPAWLGEAIAIKGPTSATFAAQSGSNLLVVGQQEEGALSVVSAALLSLAAQQPEARFYLLDGTPVDSPHVGYLPRLGESLAHPAKVAGWREVTPLLTEVAAEVERRQAAPQEPHPPIYLAICGLQRFRDLRKGEDDFGFSRRGEEKANPSQLLATVLREGPSLGVHTLVWCDSLNNLNRSFDRGALREFEMRVLFQMSASDSSTLIDNPAASKLGVHRALYHSEDRGVPEKFRPYALPAEAWLASVRERLLQRGPESIAPPEGVSAS